MLIWTVWLPGHKATLEQRYVYHSYGACLTLLSQEAALCAMHEDITCSHVSQRHFSQAFETVLPQTAIEYSLCHDIVQHD